MRRMVAHAKLPLDHLGYPWTGPDLTPETKAFCSLRQQVRDLLAFRGAQTPGCTGLGTLFERSFSAFPAPSASVHLKGGKNAQPSFTDLGLQLNASGALSGLGNGDVLVTLDATAAGARRRRDAYLHRLKTRYPPEFIRKQFGSLGGCLDSRSSPKRPIPPSKYAKTTTFKFTSQSSADRYEKRYEIGT